MSEIGHHCHTAAVATYSVVHTLMDAHVRNVIEGHAEIAAPAMGNTIGRALESGSTERSGRGIVKIVIEATPDPVKAIRVQVNGRQIDEQTPDNGTRDGERSTHPVDRHVPRRQCLQSAPR